MGDSGRPPDTFNFMGLPGEIRNIIYAFVLATPSPNIYNGVYNHDTDAAAHRGLHLLGFTQVNTVIRTEFRPLWLPEFSVPVTLIASFIKIFYPLPLRPSKPLSTRRRIAKYLNTEGLIKVSARLLRLTDTEILPLIKLKHRFPDMQVMLRRRFQGHSLSPNRRYDLRDMLQNDNEKWMRWIKRGVITQIRLVNHATVFKIVVKSQYAPVWMRKARLERTDVPWEFQQDLGLSGMRLLWGVAYC